MVNKRSVSQPFQLNASTADGLPRMRQEDHEVNMVSVHGFEMPLFSKKAKPRAIQTGIGSQPALVIPNRSLPRDYPKGSTQDEEALVQDFLSLIERQAIEINELRHDLSLKDSALHDCLLQINIPRADESTELQRKTLEWNSARNELQEQGRLVRQQLEDAQQELTGWYLEFDTRLEQRIDELATELQGTEERNRQQREEHERVKGRLENQRSEERQRFEEQTRIERLEAQSRAQRAAEQFAEELNQKGRSITELEEQIQTQVETSQQATLALNRTRNELNEEKRRALRAVEESATKSQQLEFVQQQCARLQEELRLGKAVSPPSQSGLEEEVVVMVKEEDDEEEEDGDGDKVESLGFTLKEECKQQ